MKDKIGIMRKAILSAIILTLPFIFTRNVFALKKLVPKTTAVRYTGGVSIPAVVRYQPNHLGLNLSFSNFSGLDSVSYFFTYNTNGIAEGIGGTITAANDPTAVRELLFGTCSRGACAKPTSPGP